MKKMDKIRGSLIGGAIGDALGYQIEFNTGIKDKQVTKYQNNYGIISDDTQMTLFTANALLSCVTRGASKGISASPIIYIYNSYLDWLQTQTSKENINKVCWIRDIPELNEKRAPGNTCISALLSGKKGTLNEPINDSKGCGTIMRVAPIGLYIGGAEEAGMLAAEASALTHGHPLAIIPSYVCAVLINILVKTNKTIKEALDEAMNIYREKFNIYNEETNKYFIALVNKAIELSKKNITDIEAIEKLGGGWVAEEAFAIAIYSCLKYENSFKDAIICAVNHDGDSDSTGAIAGNIMGAYCGYSNIPKYYKNNLELKDIILELADDLAMEVPVDEYKKNNDKYWISKYSNCNRDGKKKSFWRNLWKTTK